VRVSGRGQGRGLAVACVTWLTSASRRFDDRAGLPLASVVAGSRSLKAPWSVRISGLTTHGGPPTGMR
jgi:hypothetical protein